MARPIHPSHVRRRPDAFGLAHRLQRELEKRIAEWGLTSHCKIYREGGNWILIDIGTDLPLVKPYRVSIRPAGRGELRYCDPVNNHTFKGDKLDRAQATIWGYVNELLAATAEYAAECGLKVQAAG